MKLKPAKALRGDYVEVEFMLGLESWRLLIENADDSYTGNSYGVQGRSRAVLLAEPYAQQISDNWQGVNASDIALELCDDAGIVLDWQVMDWLVDSFIADKRYPIDIISELANDIGAIVQSLPDGTLAVVYDPVCSPNKIDEQLPDFSIATDTNLFTRSRKFTNHTNYNRVLITKEAIGTLSNAATVSIEETTDGNDRLLSIFIVPFVADINLQHTSGDNVAVFYEGVFTQDNTDQLLIQDGKAQLSKPYHELSSVRWHQNVLAQLAIDKRGQVTANQGLGLVTINYKTRYHRYRFNRVNDIDLTAVAMDEIPTPTDISALSMELAIGDGDRVAPPIVCKHLSSLPALKARGEAFLWAQLYDADEYSIECAYQHRPMLPTKVALVAIRNESSLFKGIIKSVSISIDTTITQSVVIERSLK